MKKKIISVFVLAAILFGSGAFAQAASSNATSPSTPAPDRIVYVPQLPAASQLTDGAAAHNVAVERLDQSASEVTIVYKYANGQTTTVAYRLLSSAGTAPAATMAPSSATVVQTTTPPTVVYTTPAPVYYYDPYYYPWSWFDPVIVGVGIGFGFHGHGGFHGGFHGHGGFHHR